MYGGLGILRAAKMHQFRGANASREKILTDYQP
jgi:hypothetical protein